MEPEPASVALTSHVDDSGSERGRFAQHRRETLFFRRERERVGRRDPRERFRVRRLSYEAGRHREARRETGQLRAFGAVAHDDELGVLPVLAPLCHVVKHAVDPFFLHQTAHAHVERAQLEPSLFDVLRGDRGQVQGRRDHLGDAEHFGRDRV